MSRSRLLTVIVILTAGLVPVWAYLLPGLPSGHNFEFQPIRVLTILDTWNAGRLIPRWCPSLAAGLGYPLWIYYGWAPYAVAGIVALSGSAAFGIKAATVFFAFVMAIGSWRLGKSLGGRAGAVVCCAAYSFAPYHLLNIYVRASFSEYAAAALLPWILLSMRRVVLGTTWHAALPAGLLIALLLFTHNTTAFIFGPAAVLYCALLYNGMPRYRQLGAAKRLGIALLVAAGASVHFWAPLVKYRDAVNLARVYDNDLVPWPHFLAPWQLFVSRWDYGYSVPGTNDGMSFYIGTGTLGLLLASVATMCGAAKPAHLLRRRVLMGSVMAAVAFAFLTTSMSEPIWRAFPPLMLIQFPWRLLLGVSLFAAVAGGAAVPALLYRVRADRQLPAAIAVAAVVVFTSLPYCRPASHASLEDASLRRILDQAYMTTTISDDYRPTAAPAPETLMKRVNRDAVLLNGEPVAAPLPPFRNRMSVGITFPAPSSGEVVFPVYYYPGWHAVADDYSVEAKWQPQTGMLHARLPHPTTSLRATWTPTPFMHSAAGLAAAVWIVSLELMAGEALSRRRRRLSGTASLGN